MARHIFLFFVFSLSATAFNISANRSWFLKGDGLTPNDTISLKIHTLNQDTAWIMQIDQQPPRPFIAKFSAGELEPGHHMIYVYSPDKFLTAHTEITVSYPLYVVVSTDWDNTRTGNRVLGYIEGLHSEFRDLKLTHFFAPYHYTDPQLSETRRVEIEQFIKRQRDQNGDELGVHIHGWCHFINTTGVPCRTKETFATDDGTGYTTILAAYTTLEMTSILKTAVDIYAKQGLGRPISFRAGGWTADDKVFQALLNNGFLIDTSAVPPQYLISWEGYTLYDWNMARWKNITETSQPYFPLPGLLEVPDNGVLVDYLSTPQMIHVFDLNFPNRAPLAKSTVYQIGFHPVDSFSRERYQRMIDTLHYVERYSYKKDQGPVRYVTISELIRAHL